MNTFRTVSLVALAAAFVGCDPEVCQLPSGELTLTQTKVIGAAESGTLFRGAADGSTRVTAGIPVTGWTDRGGGVWGAKLPKGRDGRPVYTESLFVNGRRAQRSRFPEEGFLKVQSVRETDCAESPTGNRIFLRLAPDGEAAKVLKATPRDELKYAHFMTHIKWDVARYPISGFTNDEVSVDGQQMKKFNTYCIWSGADFYAMENLRGAFAKPGQWFYDAKAGEVLYRPLAGETIREAVVPTDGLETLLSVCCATNVVFENITFAFSAPVSKPGMTWLDPWQAAARVSTAAVVVDRSRDIVFRNCRFEHLGSYAVWFREGCRGGGVFDSELTDLGAGGVRIGSCARKGTELSLPKEGKRNVPYVETAPWMTSHVSVDNCLIAHGGRFHPAGVGVFVAHASDCRIVHNDIFDLLYRGVSLGWVWGYSGSPAQRNTVAFNHIYDIGQAKLADMGGIYLLGAAFGTVVANNLIHGVRTYSYGGWGLYPDEGSEGLLIENNIVYDTDDASFHQHYGADNVLRNNILIDSKAGQIAVSRAEPHRSAVIERNIILWTQGEAFRKYEGTKGEKAKIDWRNNIWWRTDGKEDFNGTSFKAWCGRVKDEGSVFADPLFVDWKNRDFTLKEDSPALKLGFKPIDVSAIGRQPR